MEGEWRGVAEHTRHNVTRQLAVIMDACMVSGEDGTVRYEVGARQPTPNRKYTLFHANPPGRVKLHPLREQITRVMPFAARLDLWPLAELLAERSGRRVGRPVLDPQEGRTTERLRSAPPQPGQSCF